MSVKAIGWVWDNSQSEGAARLTLLAIADCVNASGNEAWPSMAELIRKTRLSERGVQKAIRRLEELGELKVAKAGGRGRTNRYALPIETPNRVRGSKARNPEQSAGFSEPRTECGVSDDTPAGQPGDSDAQRSSETPNSVRETPNHVRPEPERTVSTEEGSQAARDRASAEAIPDWALPLVHKIHAAGLPGLRWNLIGDDWFMVHSLMQKKGVEAMADYAARVSASSARPVFSARYFLSGWKELIDAPPDGTTAPALRAIRGGTDSNVADHLALAAQLRAEENREIR